MASGYRSSVPDASSNFTDGGLRTGDSGFLLDGELFVVGRVGDSIKVRGRKVHAEDLETALTVIDGIPSGRCAVALGTTGEAHHVVAVVESGEAGWLDGALAVVRAATDDTVRVTVVRTARAASPHLQRQAAPAPALAPLPGRGGHRGGRARHGSRHPRHRLSRRVPPIRRARRPRHARRSCSDSFSVIREFRRVPAAVTHALTT